MLETEGFLFDRYVDIFDGGPTVTARTDEIRTVRESREETIAEIGDGGPAKVLVAAGRLKDFRACCGIGQEAVDEGRDDRSGGGASCSRSRSATRSSTVSRVMPSRNQFRRDRRAEPQLCRASASATSPRRAQCRRRYRSRAPRRCRASTRCAPTSRSGCVRASSCRTRGPTARGSAELGDDDRGRRAGARRQCHVGLGDVGGQCRDGLARARYGRRQVPPDRRQPQDHAAPQP